MLQVYLDGVFYAAVLDDVVMQPLTGNLMGVLYRYYTPGGNHLAAHGTGQLGATSNPAAACSSSSSPKALRLSAACPGVGSLAA